MRRLGVCVIYASGDPAQSKDLGPHDSVLQEFLFTFDDG